MTDSTDNLQSVEFFKITQKKYIYRRLNSEYSLQVLCGCNPRWVATSGGNIPPNAIPGGESEDGEPLFVGRVNHEGTLTIGKVQPSHNVLYIPFGGAEVAFPDYEILVSE